MTFEGESTNLTQDGKREMRQLVQFLKYKPDLRVTIYVQAQPFVERRFNRLVAEKRARVIESALTKGGIGSLRYVLVCKEYVEVTSPRDNRKQKFAIKLR